MRWHWLIGLTSLLGCVACGSVIAPQVQSLADPEHAYTQLASNPEAYVGKMVIIAGIIVEAVNTPEGTRLVLLQYPTNRRGRPQTHAPSGGRFLVLAPEYLETVIYRSGRAGSHLRRDTLVSVMYAEKLHAAQSAVTLQRTDRHAILG
jgi:starvation-inducible outer membrane lipoprotein